MKLSENWARIVLWVPGVVAIGVAGMTDAQESIEKKARRIHRNAIVIDTHSDTTPKFEDPAWDFAARHADGHMDIPRLREGGFDAQFFSIYMGRTPGDGTAVKRALKRIDSVHQMVRRYPEDFILATTAKDIRKAAARGKIAALMGVEGGHIIEDDLAALRMFHELGVRYMTLTHSFNTNWADSAGTGQRVQPEHDGLTDFGREVVLEMNRLGMMVDVSHVADSTFWDALDVSKAPLLASHSSCRALADHPRNMSDEMIRAMAEKGGVIMINFYPGYIDPAAIEIGRGLIQKFTELEEQFGDDPQRLSQERRRVQREAFANVKTPASVVVDHIEHVIRLVGPDHVGLGADWDGVSSLPEGLEDCSKVPYITEELLRRGHSARTVRKVLGGNLLRLMEHVEAVAKEMR